MEYRKWHNVYEKYGIKKDITYSDKSMVNVLREVAKRYPRRVALEYMGRKITYKRLIRLIDMCATGLVLRGIKRGDVVSLCLPNIPNTVIAFYALNLIGAIPCMIHPLSTPSEIARFLEETNSKMLIAFDFIYPKLLDKQNVIVAKAFDYILFPCKSWRSIMKKPLLIEDNGSGGDTAAILYSGATSTGKPKGILLSNANFNALAESLCAVVNQDKEQKSMLAILPLFHGFGLGICMHTMLTQGFSVILEPRFSTKIFANAINKRRPTHIAGIPSMYKALMKKSKNLDLSCIKGIFCGGDFASVDFKQNFNKFIKEHNGNVAIREGYGLTEMVTACVIMPDEDGHISSVGIPMPGVDVKILDFETGQPCEEGEICLAGPMVMKGYLGDQKEIDWLHTGDRGHIDAEGYLYFTERVKRIIKRSGFPVYPSAVEEVILKCDGVTDCAVVGIPDEFYGQRVAAYIVGKTTEEQIIEHCKEFLNKWSVPSKVVFLDNLPLTKLGKVDYNCLN